MALEAGTQHVAYVLGLAVVTALLLLVFARAALPRAAFTAGAIVAVIKGFAAIPQAAVGGGLTGSFLLVPSVMSEMVVVGLAAAGCFGLLKRIAR